MIAYRTLLGCLLAFTPSALLTFAEPPASQPATRAALSEPEKIERLIQAVSGLQDAVFIRNDQEHTAADAAEHMRRKLKAAGDRVRTVEEFIENIASKSNATGKPYKIRFKDGREVESAAFLREMLKEIEGG
jgi:deferrochelatase/peroxidase EfeB